MEQAHTVLKQYWGYDKFRPIQGDIIQSVLSGNDGLALLPTGGGKSLCYQVPALVKPGICLVISPLIALIRDQLQQLDKLGIKATGLISGMRAKEVDIALDNCVYGDFKLLYMSPERLANDMVLARLEKMNISLLAVDEAHCISQWGHDFRPAYRRIAEIRPLIGDAPVLALTASAPPHIQKDILEQLELKEPKKFQASFARSNLSYVVRPVQNKEQHAKHILDRVKGTSIIYVRNRKRTKEIAETLFQKGVAADYYHAGLGMDFRQRKQEAWTNGRTRVMVCTNAFGMGIDKPDVRTVIHLDLPENVESYYQEAGRAGRDGKRSFAILLIDDQDIGLAQYRIKTHYPTFEQIVAIYTALGNYYQLALGSGEGQSFDFDIAEFSRTFKFDIPKVVQALRILEQHELLLQSDASYTGSRIQVLVNREGLYKFQIANARFDPLLKVLMRSQHGIFDELVPLNEFQLSRILKMDKDKLIVDLEYLRSRGLLDYKKQTDLPKLTYLTGRQQLAHPQLDRHFVEDRKKVYVNDLTQMLSYAQNDSVCRTRFLQEHFGEKVDEDCGKCDVCLDRDKPVKGQDMKAMTATLKDLLAHRALALPEIVDRFERYSPAEILDVLRWHLDEGHIELHNDTYHWKG